MLQILYRLMSMICSTWVLPSQFFHNQHAGSIWERNKGLRINTVRKILFLKSGSFPEHLCDPTRGRSFIGHYYAHQISNLLNAFSPLPFNRILTIYPHTCSHFFWITFFHFSILFLQFILAIFKKFRNRTPRGFSHRIFI